MINSYGLDDEQLKDIMKVLASEKKVKSAVLFGSRAKGNYTNGSDIDIAISGEELNLNHLLELLIQIDTLFLPYTGPDHLR